MSRRLECCFTFKCKKVKKKFVCIMALYYYSYLQHVSRAVWQQSNICIIVAGKLTIIKSQKLKDLEKYVQYYGLAVVKKGTKFNFTQLKGKHSCHTGVGKTVGWVIPVGHLLHIKEMTYTDNQYKSVADFFSKSCAPGTYNSVRFPLKNLSCICAWMAPKNEINTLPALIPRYWCNQWSK